MPPYGRVDRSQIKDHVLVWSGSRVPSDAGQAFLLFCGNLGPHSLRSTPNYFRHYVLKMLRSAKGASRGDSKPAPPDLRSHNNADWDQTSEGDSTLSALGGSGPTHTRHCAYRLQLVCTTAALASTDTHTPLPSEEGRSVSPPDSALRSATSSAAFRRASRWRARAASYASRRRRHSEAEKCGRSRSRYPKADLDGHSPMASCGNGGGGEGTCHSPPPRVALETSAASAAAAQG